MSANKDQFRELVAAARAKLKDAKKKSSKKDVAQASTSAEASTSRLREVTTESTPAVSSTENSAIQELDVVVVSEEEVGKRRDDSGLAEGSEVWGNLGAELDRTGSLFSEGSGEENEQGSPMGTKDSNAETPEGSLHAKQGQPASHVINLACVKLQVCMV